MAVNALRRRGLCCGAASCGL